MWHDPMLTHVHTSMVSALVAQGHDPGQQVKRARDKASLSEALITISCIIKSNYQVYNTCMLTAPAKHVFLDVKHSWCLLKWQWMTEAVHDYDAMSSGSFILNIYSSSSCEAGTV